MRIGQAPAPSPVLADEATLFKNSLYYETLLLLNLQPVLVDSLQYLFFAIPEGSFQTLTDYQKHIQHLSKYDPDFALKKAASIRSLLLSNLKELFSKAKLEGLEEIEEELDRVLTDCWSGTSFGSNIKEQLSTILDSWSAYKESVDNELQSLPDQHQQLMDEEDYTKIYARICRIFLLLGKNSCYQTAENAAIYLYTNFDHESLITDLIRTETLLIDHRLKSGKESLGEEFPRAYSLQRGCLVHEQWLRALAEIEKVPDDRESWSFCHKIMTTLRFDKIAFYHQLYTKNEMITLAALVRTHAKTTLDESEAALKKLEEAIDEKESTLKCYSWEKATANFLLLSITRNVFFSLGKEFFIAAERNAPGTKLEEPFLTCFSYLAGGAILGAQVYASPAMAGPALILHSLTQAVLSDAKRLKQLSHLPEETIFRNYSSILIGSSMAISLLTTRSQGLIRFGFQLSCSQGISHYTIKALDYSNQKNPTVRIISSIASNTVGFYLASLLWQAGEDFAFEHFSDDTLLLDDALCTKFQRKCLHEAYRELCVEGETPLAEIKKHYRGEARLLHPDKNPHIDPLHFKRLGAAMKVVETNANFLT